MLASSSSDDEVDDHPQQSICRAPSGGSLVSANRNVRGSNLRGVPGSNPTPPGQANRKPHVQPTAQLPNGAKCSRSPHQIFSSTSSRSSLRSNDAFDGNNSRSKLVDHSYPFYFIF